MANYRLAEDFSATEVEAIESGANPSQYGPRPGTQGAWVKLTRGRDQGKLAFHYLPIPSGDGVQQINPSEALRELQGLGVSQSQGSLPGPEQVQRNSASISNPFDLLSQMQASGRLTQNQSNEWVGMLQQASNPNAELVEVPEFGILPDVWGIFQQFGITPTISSDASFHLGDETQFSVPLYQQGIGKGDVAKLLELVKTKIKPKEIQKIEDDSTLITKSINSAGQEQINLHPKAITSMIHLLLQIESTMPVIPQASLRRISSSGTPAELMADYVGDRIENLQGIARNIGVSEFLNEESDVLGEYEDPESNPALQGDIRYSQTFPSRTTHITANAHRLLDHQNIVNRWNIALSTVTGTLNWEVLSGQRKFTAEDILQAFPRMPGVLDDSNDVKSIAYTILWLNKNLPQQYQGINVRDAGINIINEILTNVTDIPDVIKVHVERALNIIRNSESKWQGITKSQDFKKNLENMETALSLTLQERILNAKKAIDFNDLSGIPSPDGRGSVRAGQFRGHISFDENNHATVVDENNQVLTDEQGFPVTLFPIGDFTIDAQNNLWVSSHKWDQNTGAAEVVWRKIAGDSLDFVSQILQNVDTQGNTDGNLYIRPINPESFGKLGNIANSQYKLSDSDEYIKILPSNIPNGTLQPYAIKIMAMLQQNPFSGFHQQLFDETNPAFVQSDLYGKYGPTESPERVSEDISSEPFHDTEILADFLKKQTSAESLRYTLNLFGEMDLFNAIITRNNLSKEFIQNLSPEIFHNILRSMSISEQTKNLLYEIGGGGILSQGPTDVFAKAIIYSHLVQENNFNLPTLTVDDLQKISNIIRNLHSKRDSLTSQQKQTFAEIMDSIKLVISSFEGLDSSGLNLPMTNTAGPNVNIEFNQRFDELVRSCMSSNFSIESFKNLSNLINNGEYSGAISTTKTVYGNISFSQESINILHQIVELLKTKNFKSISRDGGKFFQDLALSQLAQSRLQGITSPIGTEDFVNGLEENPNQYINDSQRQKLIDTEFFKDRMYSAIFYELATKLIKKYSNRETEISKIEIDKIKQDISSAVILNEPSRILIPEIRALLFPPVANSSRSQDTFATTANNEETMRAALYKDIFAQTLTSNSDIKSSSGNEVFPSLDTFNSLGSEDKKYIEDLFKKKVGTLSESSVQSFVPYIHKFNAPLLAKYNSEKCSETITSSLLNIEDGILPKNTDENLNRETLKHIATIAYNAINGSNPVTNKDAIDLMVTYKAAHDFFVLRNLEKTIANSAPKIDGFDIPRTYEERTGLPAPSHYANYKEFYDILVKSTENKLAIAKDKNIRIIRGNDPAFPSSLQIAHPSSTKANPMGLTDSISLLGDSSLLYSPKTASFHAGVNGIGLDVPSVESGDTYQLDFWAGQLINPQTISHNAATFNAQAKLETMSKEIREVAAHYGLGLDKKIVQMPSGESKTAEEIIGFFDGIKNKNIFSEETKEQIHIASLQMEEALRLITEAKDKYISEVIEPFVQKMRENNHHIVVTHGYDRTGGITIGKKSVQSSVVDVPFFKTPWQHSDDIIHNIFWSKILNEEPSVAEKINPNMFDELVGVGLNFSSQNSQIDPFRRSLQSFSYLGTNFDNVADAFALAILLHPANNFAIPDVEKFVQHIQSRGIQLSKLISLNGSINENELRAFFPVGNEPESWKKSWHKYAEEIGPGQTDVDYFKYQLSSVLTGAYHNLGSPVLKESIQKRLEGILRGILYAKISQNQSLKNDLLGTGDAKLSGVNAGILMSIRQQLKETTAESGSKLIIIPRSSTFAATEIKPQSKRAFDISWQDAYHTAGQYGNLVISPMLPVTKTTSIGLELPSWGSGDFLEIPDAQAESYGRIILPKENGLKLVSRKINRPEVIAARGSAGSDDTYSSATSINDLHNQEETHAIKLALSRNIFLGNLPSLQMNFDSGNRIGGDQTAIEAISSRLRTSFGQNKAVTVLQRVLASFKQKGLDQFSGFSPAIFPVTKNVPTNDESFNEYLKILESGVELIVDGKTVVIDYDRNNALPQGDLGGVGSSPSARNSYLADGIISGQIRFGINLGPVWYQNKNIDKNSYGDYKIGPVQNISDFSLVRLFSGISAKDYIDILKNRVMSINSDRIKFSQVLTPFQSSGQNSGLIYFSPQLSFKLNPNLVIADISSNEQDKKRGILKEIGKEIPVISSYQLRFGNNGEFVVTVRVGNIKSRVGFGSSGENALQINTVFSVELSKILSNGQSIKLTENTYAQPYRIPEIKIATRENTRGQAIFDTKIIGGQDLGKIYDEYSSSIEKTIYSLAKNEIANYVASTIHQIIFASGDMGLIHPIIPTYGPQVNPLFPSSPDVPSPNGPVSSAQIAPIDSEKSLPIKILFPNQSNINNLFTTKTHRSRSDLSVKDGGKLIDTTSMQAGAGILLPDAVTSLLNFAKNSEEISANSQFYWLRLPSPFSVSRENFGINSQSAIYNLVFPFGIPDIVTSHTDNNGNPMTIEQIMAELGQMAANGTWDVQKAGKLATVIKTIYPKNNWAQGLDESIYSSEQDFLQNIFKTDPNNQQLDENLSEKRARYWTTTVVPLWNDLINNLHQTKEYLTGAKTQMDVSQEFDPYEEFSKYFGIPIETVRQMTTQDFINHYENLKKFADLYVATSGQIQNGITQAIKSSLQNLRSQNVFGNMLSQNFDLNLTNESRKKLLTFIANSNGDFSQIGTIGPLNIQQSALTIPVQHIESIANEIVQTVGSDRIFGFAKKIKDFAQISGRFVGTNSGWIDRLFQRSYAGQILSADPQSPIVARIFSGMSSDTGAGIQTPTNADKITEFNQDLLAETFLQNMSRQRSPVIATFMPILSYSGINTDVEGAKIAVSADMPAIITTKNGSVNKTVMQILSALYVPQGTGVDFSIITKTINESIKKIQEDPMTGMFGDHKHLLIINPLLMGNIDPKDGPVDLRSHFISSLFSNIAFVPQSDTSAPSGELRSDSLPFKATLRNLGIEPESCEGTFGDNLLGEFFTQPQIQSMDGKVRRAFIYSVLHAMSRHIRPDFDQVNISKTGIKLRDEYLQLKNQNGIEIPELIDADNLSKKSIGYAIPSAPIEGGQNDAEIRREEFAKTPFLRQFLRAVYKTSQMTQGFVPNMSNASTDVVNGSVDIQSHQAGFSYSPLVNDDEIEAALWVLNAFATSEMYRPETTSGKTSAGQHVVDYNRLVPDSVNPGQLFVNMGSSQSPGSRIILAVKAFIRDISEESKFHTFSVNDSKLTAVRDLNRRLQLQSQKDNALSINLSDQEKSAIAEEAIKRAILKETGIEFDRKYMESLIPLLSTGTITEDILKQLSEITRQMSYELVQSKRTKLGNVHEEQRSRIIRQKVYVQEEIEKIERAVANGQINSIVGKGMINGYKKILDSTTIDGNLRQLWSQQSPIAQTDSEQSPDFRFLGNSLLEQFLGLSLTDENYAHILNNEEAHLAELGSDILQTTPANIILSQFGLDSGLHDIVRMNPSGEQIISSEPIQYNVSPQNTATIFSLTDARSIFSPYNTFFPISFVVQGSDTTKYNFVAKTLAQFMFAMEIDAEKPEGLAAIREILDVDFSRGRGSIADKIHRRVRSVYRKYSDAFTYTENSNDHEFLKFIVGLRLQAEQNPRFKNNLLSTQSNSDSIIAEDTEESRWGMEKTEDTYSGINILGKAIQTVARALSLSNTINTENKISQLIQNPLDQIISRKLDIATFQKNSRSVSPNPDYMLNNPFVQGYEIAYVSGKPSPKYISDQSKMDRGTNIIGPRNIPVKYFEYFNLRTNLDQSGRGRSLHPTAIEEPVEFLCKGPDGEYTARAGGEINPDVLPIKSILHYLLLSKFINAPFSEKQIFCSAMIKKSPSKCFELLLANTDEMPNIIANYFPELDAQKYQNEYLNPDWETNKDLYLAYAMAKIAHEKGLMTKEGFGSNFFENIHNGSGDIAYWVPPDQNQNSIINASNKYYGVLARTGAIELNPNSDQYRGHNAIGRTLTWLIRQTPVLISQGSNGVLKFIERLEQEISYLGTRTTGFGPNITLSQMLDIENDPEFAVSSAESSAARDEAQQRRQQTLSVPSLARPIDPGPEETLDRDPDAWADLSGNTLMSPKSLSNTFVINILKKSILSQKKPIVTFKISTTRKNR